MIKHEVAGQARKHTTFHEIYFTGGEKNLVEFFRGLTCMEREPISANEESC